MEVAPVKGGQPHAFITTVSLTVASVWVSDCSAQAPDPKSWH